MMLKEQIKKDFVLLLFMSLFMCVIGNAQTTSIASSYKHISITATDNADYARSLVLLHEIYNDVDLLNENYAIGTITARRGWASSVRRLNVAHVHTSSAYNSVSGSIMSNDDSGAAWKLKTCFYNGKKYLAVDVPYAAARHGNGFQFVGWVNSSGESMKFIVYQVNGVPRNQDVLTAIEDYVPNRNITHFTSTFNVMGKVGIGTTAPREALAVNGNIRAKEIKVETANWPDYVFEEGYELKSLAETERYIKNHGHLPDVPTAEEVESDGQSLGEINKILLKKIEEMTLHLIEKEKVISRQSEELGKTKDEISKIKDFLGIQ